MGFEKKYPELVQNFVRSLIRINPNGFFALRLQEKYPELAQKAAQYVLSNNPEDFFYYDLQETYPEFEQNAAQALLIHDLNMFFEMGFEKKYPELLTILTKNLPEGFTSEQDVNEEFYMLSKSNFQGVQRPEETRELERYEFSLNNPLTGEKSELENDILSNLHHQLDVGTHRVGVPGYTKSWGLVSFPNKQEIIVEQVQSDLPVVMYEINKNQEQKEELIDRYGKEQYKEFMRKYSQHALLYPYEVLENIAKFAIENQIHTIKLSTFENIMDVANIGNEKKAKKIYQEIPEKLGFKKQGSFYVYSGDMKTLIQNIQQLKNQEVQPSRKQISKRDKKDLNLQAVRETLNNTLGERAQKIEVSNNVGAIMKSLSNALKQNIITRKEFKALQGLIPRLTLASIEEMMVKIATYVDKLSKRADLEPKTNLQVIVEPFDPAVDRALKKLPQHLTKNVTKVIVHQEGGPGQLGHVEMGPNKDPREIHLFKNRIVNQVQQMFGTSRPTPQQLDQAIEQSLMEVIAHEGIHIGPEKTQEQILDPSFRFRGEGETEMATQQQMKSMFPQAYAQLNSIKNKYLPLHKGNLNLEFIVLSKQNKPYDLVKSGINAILNPQSINNIIKHNQDVIHNNAIAKSISTTHSPTTIKGIVEIAEQQYNNKEPITGKLSSKKKDNKYPRNFGVVVSGKLYRGGFIDNIKQLQALKDLGVERVVSLHNNPDITRMCNKLGLEHVIAPIETGKPEEYGRKILGDNISKYLLKKPTYVHCWFGKDRTGGVIARFRTENGWSNKDAYLEAKSYGFTDIFVDLIEWFCENNGKPPVDTVKIRTLLKQSPYENPEIIEQNAIAPLGTPTDTPFRNYNSPYYTWTDDITGVNPYMSLSMPTAISLDDDGYMDRLVDLSGLRGEVKEEQPIGGIAMPTSFYI